MRKLTVLCILTLVMLSAHAADEDMLKSSDGWPIVLVGKPIHIGDQTAKNFAQASPQGTELRREFLLDDHVPVRLYLGIWVSDMITKRDAMFKKGYYHHELYVNDEHTETLNKKLIHKDETSDVVKIVIELNAPQLRKGLNTIYIKAGGRGTNIDDFQIHKMVLDTRKP